MTVSHNTHFKMRFKGQDVIPQLADSTAHFLGVMLCLLLCFSEIGNGVQPYLDIPSSSQVHEFYYCIERK